VISAQTEKAIELFLERERAEAFIAEIEQDEPRLAALLRVEPVELGLDRS
jgi:Tic22-like family